MGDEIERLRARREHLINQADRIRQAIDALENAQAVVDQLLNDGVDMSAQSSPPLVPVARADEDTPPPRKRAPNGSSPDAIATAAAAIIAERGKPMTRFELIEPIEARGLTIGGVDKPRNLARSFGAQAISSAPVTDMSPRRIRCCIRP